MKQTLCALAIGATLVTPVMAFANTDVKVYGRAHVSLDYLDDGKDYNEVGLSSNASRLGFKAEKKLENGMTIFGQIEQQVNFASGSKDSADSVDFSTRDTFVGLKGNYGQVKVGRFDTPFKAARGPVNFFGDQVGDLRNLARAGDHRFDERNENTIEYKTPKFGAGFQAAAALSLHANTMIAKDDEGQAQKDNKAYDVALTYKEGPIDFAIAYAHFDANAANARAESDRDAFRVAGAYKLTDALNVGAFFQMGEIDIDSQKDANVYGVAADYKISSKTYVRGQVFQRDVEADDSNSTLVALGVEHRLDPAVRVYANLATVLNDEKAKLTPWEQARSNKVTGATGEDAAALSVGLRYDF